METRRLSYSELLKLKRWNTPTIYNGWEQVTEHSILENFNKEEVRDFMPNMGPMVGYAITVKFEPSKKEHTANVNAWDEYRRYVASVPGPKIVVVQDLDKPACYGAFWGEVNSNIHKALGCVGTIVDGAVRDLDEMNNAGFKAIGRRMCVGHAYSTPVEWNCEVEVFGCKVKPGQLIHADKHGFLVIPDEDAPRLLEASKFMDDNECMHTIACARSMSGKTYQEICDEITAECTEFSKDAASRDYKHGEW